jgi:hypothetical protein
MCARDRRALTDVVCRCWGSEGSYSIAGLEDDIDAALMCVVCVCVCLCVCVYLCLCVCAFVLWCRVTCCVGA